MYIKSFDVSIISLPFLSPIFYADRWLDRLDSAILRLGDGAHFGYAEVPVTCAPNVSPEEIRKTLEEEYAPKVLGNSFMAVHELRDALGALAERAIPFGAVEIAWWDLAAKIKGKPLHEMLGAPYVLQEVFTSVDRPAGEYEDIDVNAFLENVKSLADAGYVHLELKVRPGWERAMLHAVRQMLPGQSLHIDVEALMREKHVMSLCQLQDYLPWMIEQPLAADDFVGHADLAGMLHTPIGLDESIVSVNAAKTALRLGGVKCLKINPVRVGGMEAVKDILTLCREHGADVWISSPVQTGIGASAALAAGCLEGVTGPFEYHDPKRYFAEAEMAAATWLPEPVREEDGLLRIGEGVKE